VQPIFNQRCIGCHGENGKEGIDLRTYDSVMKGGEPGLVVKPGDAKGSLLVQMIQEGHAKRMPFKQDPLTDDQIKQIEDWVNGGAKG
jgi:mono/diheme cytochrome c family protein